MGGSRRMERERRRKRKRKKWMRKEMEEEKRIWERSKMGRERITRWIKKKNGCKPRRKRKKIEKVRGVLVERREEGNRKGAECV